MAKTAKWKPPSKGRHEEAHPIVSIGVSRDIYQRLQAAKQALRKFPEQNG